MNPVPEEILRRITRDELGAGIRYIRQSISARVIDHIVEEAKGVEHLYVRVLAYSGRQCQVHRRCERCCERRNAKSMRHRRVSDVRHVPNDYIVRAGKLERGHNRADILGEARCSGADDPVDAAEMIAASLDCRQCVQDILTAPGDDVERCAGRRIAVSREKECDLGVKTGRNSAAGKRNRTNGPGLRTAKGEVRPAEQRRVRVEAK
jgi:hypothetical protein